MTAEFVSRGLGLTVSRGLEEGRTALSARGVPEARANAEFLMAAALGCGRAELHAAHDRVLTAKQGRRYRGLVEKRGFRIPLAYVLGNQPFLGVDIKVTDQVLIPRPETERLVECAVEEARSFGRTQVHIVDVGTGSGCIPVALAKLLPDAMLYATDISREALRIAEENARRNGVAGRIRFLREDLFKPAAAAAGWADIVVSNPPYIPTAELATLDAEVRKEPVLALDGGKDGLAAVRAIAADAPRMLKPGGRLLFEFGDGQGGRVAALLERGGFTDISLRPDYSGRERVAVASLGKC